MNEKDLKRTHLDISSDAKAITIGVHDAKGELTPLQKDAKLEFMNVMQHYLIVMSENGKKPVILSRGGIPTFKVTIDLVDEMKPVPAPSLILDAKG